MDEQHFGQAARQTPSFHPSSPAQVATSPTEVATPEAVADVSPDDFTWTVEDLARKLANQDTPRDTRTIQRWCASGKVRAIYDRSNGERWKIDPASAEKTANHLFQELEEQRRQAPPTPADVPRHAATPPDTVADKPATDATEANNSNNDMSNSDADNAATRHDKSRHDADNAATLQQRVDELERENIDLRISSESRRQVIHDMRAEYKEALGHALERSELVGQLKQEVEQLRAQLPAPEETVHRHSETPQSEGV